ncbi:hypothetical protein GGS21DRAFT_266989 [Xylaria nigripes]|nr:hypothetical protein GGS21DRAFT_266989 [Xylaria nigripes]
MMLSRIFFLASTALFCLVLSSARDDMSDAPSQTTHSPTQTITVGRGSFTFTPDSITAEKGDKIVFEFWSDGHTVSRSQFGFPCMPYEFVTPGGIGFFSGDIPPVHPTSHPKWSITINDTDPVFFYCSAPGSCKANHMIGVINQNDTWTLASQKALIDNNVIDLSPTDPVPSEISGSTSTATSTPQETARPTSQSTEPGTDRTSALSSGEIAGITLGSVAVLLLVGALLYIRDRRSVSDGRYRHSAPRYKPSDHESMVPTSQRDGHGAPLPYNYTGIQPNSPQWSMYSTVTSPSHNSWRPFRHGATSPVHSQISPGHPPYVPVLPVHCQRPIC